MRYLLVSDLHYTLRQLDWVSEQAGDVDAVIFAGDHLDISSAVDLDAQIVLFLAYFARLAERTTVIVCSGNHDLTGRRSHGERAAIWLDELDQRVVGDGAHARVGNDLVSVCAWWEGPATRAEIEEQLRRDAEQAGGADRWIWVYHSPPDGSPTSWSGSRHFGDDVLNQLVAEHDPDLVLTGHVHESPFRPDGSWFDRIGSTTIINAGRQIGPVPAHVLLDTAEGTATWWSFEGEETVALGPVASAQ